MPTYDILRGSDVPAQSPDGHVGVNPDGTSYTFPADDEIISKQLICDICGTPFGEGWKIYKRGKLYLCRLCLDED